MNVFFLHIFHRKSFHGMLSLVTCHNDEYFFSNVLDCQTQNAKMTNSQIEGQNDEFSE